MFSYVELTLILCEIPRIARDDDLTTNLYSKPITMKEINWKEILKLLIAVLTAIAGTLGIVSCMS